MAVASRQAAPVIAQERESRHILTKAINKRLFNAGWWACNAQNLGHHRAHAVRFPILFAAPKQVSALPRLAFAS